MPLPLLLVPLVPWLTTALATLVTSGAGAIAYDQIKRKFNNLGPVAVQNALDNMGIELDATHPLTDEALTAAVNQTFLSGAGFQLDSILDSEKMKGGLQKVALQKVAESFGFVGVVSDVDLRNELQKWIGGEVMAQLTSESGAVIDAAKPSQLISTVIEKAPKPAPGWNTPSDVTAHGVANRLAQYKYRHSHKKTWVLR